LWSGKIAKARLEADRFLESALATAGPHLQALGRNRQACILKIANSFAAAEALRATFLAAGPVRRVLRDKVAEIRGLSQ
jgi:hypothetical protein